MRMHVNRGMCVYRLRMHMHTRGASTPNSSRPLVRGHAYAFARIHIHGARTHMHAHAHAPHARAHTHIHITYTRSSSTRAHTHTRASTHARTHEHAHRTHAHTHTGAWNVSCDSQGNAHERTCLARPWHESTVAESAAPAPYQLSFERYERPLSRAKIRYHEWKAVGQCKRYNASGTGIDTAH